MARQPLPDQIPRELLERACALIDSGKEHNFHDSTKFDLLYLKRRYPPKAVVGIASELLSNIAFKPSDFSGGLGSKCFRLLQSQGFDIVPKIWEIEDENISEEESHAVYFEGNAKVRTVRQYERSREARLQCLEIKGTECAVCKFEFSREYGEIGVGFIHVHHLEMISERDNAYTVDPIRDLVPVCPNCQFDHIFIRIPNEEANNESRQDGKSR